MDELFKDFHPSSAADWKARLEKDLKGITFDQLSLIDSNGITIHPFYSREDIAGQPEPVVTQPGWSICAQIRVTDAAVANKQALHELNNGASGLCFVIEQEIDPEILLQDIELPYIYTQFKLSHPMPAFVASLKALGAKKDWSWQEAESFLSFDYIGHYAQRGNWLESKTQDENAFAAFLEAAEEIPAFCIDAAFFQNAGANTTYQLACTLALVNEYLNLFAAAQPDKIKKIHVTLAAGTAFFEQIAGLRAFRNLLNLLGAQYNLKPALHLHIETSNLYRSPYDSYSNLLRDSIAAMAGVLGGGNSLHIHPFDESKKAANDFSRRMSRNQQLIFKEESYLDKIADAAAGSYYLETLTEQLAATAWQQFKDIESAGGFIAAFEQGRIKTTIEQQAAALVQEYKEGKRVLIGVNKFPNPTDEPQSGNAIRPETNGIAPLALAEAIL